MCPVFWSTNWCRPAASEDGGAAESEVEIFTDGSSTEGIAGWGWAAVRHGQEIGSGKGPVVTAATHPD